MFSWVVVGLNGLGNLDNGMIFDDGFMLERPTDGKAPLNGLA